MKNTMQILCKLLNGYNFTEYGDSLLFDFYDTTGNAIFTMTYKDNQIQLANDVEYYITENAYTNLTLQEYDKLIGEYRNNGNSRVKKP